MNRLLQIEFGLQVVDIKKLNGYDNANYLVKTNTAKYVFKTYGYDKELLALVEAENKTLLFLQNSDKKNFPKPIQFTDGSFVKILNIENKETICRMLSFLDGTFLGETQHTESLFQSLGICLAQMDIKLQKLNNYTIMARQWEWDLQYLNLNNKYINDISNAKDRNLVRFFFQQFEENVVPVLTKLRKQIIHNDANEWNVLVKNEVVSSIIDFGDLAYSPLINELAVAITYACYNKVNPLSWATTILKSYHSKLPIEEKEIKVLYYLIAARLSVSVCNSAHSKKINPNNKYASISEKSAWGMLYRWITINPITAENQFMTAISLSVKNPNSIEEVIKRRHQHISPILSLSYNEPIYMASSAFQYMFDVYGNTFLDAYNNIPHVGHSHPKVVTAGQKQMAKLNTNTRYLYDLLPEYTEKLLSKLPDSLNKVYFVNSGSAASDLAIRMAFVHTKHKN